jgi:hypothetical protein
MWLRVRSSNWLAIDTPLSLIFVSRPRAHVLIRIETGP